MDSSGNYASYSAFRLTAIQNKFVNYGWEGFSFHKIVFNSNENRYISQQSRTIRLPIHITEKLNKIKRVQRELSQKFGRNPTVTEIAEVLGFKPSQIREYLWLARKPISLDVSVGAEQNTQLQDLLKDESSSPFDYFVKESLKQTVQDLLSKLSPQQQEILTLRYGLTGEEELTLKQVSQRTGICQEKVLLLQRQALTFLRRYLTSCT